MLNVQLEMQEWNGVLSLLAQAPWAQANPLIMKIGEQLRTQATARRPNGVDMGDPLTEERPKRAS